jgi:hypothetical protein
MMDGPMGHVNTAVDHIMDGPMGHADNAVDHMMDGPMGHVKTAVDHIMDGPMGHPNINVVSPTCAPIRHSMCRLSCHRLSLLRSDNECADFQCSDGMFIAPTFSAHH